MKNKTVNILVSYEQNQIANYITLNFQGHFESNNSRDEDYRELLDKLSKIKKDLIDKEIVLYGLKICSHGRVKRKDKLIFRFKAAVTFLCETKSNWTVLNYLGENGFVVTSQAEYSFSFDEKIQNEMMHTLAENLTNRLAYLEALLKAKVIKHQMLSINGPTSKLLTREYVYKEKFIKDDEDPFFIDMDNPPLIECGISVLIQVTFEINENTNNFFVNNDFSHPYLFELYMCAMECMKNDFNTEDISLLSTVLACKEPFKPNDEEQKILNCQLIELVNSMLDESIIK